jgi:peptidyl-prolyl cis-trans isomerase SurA
MVIGIKLFQSRGVRLSVGLALILGVAVAVRAEVIEQILVKVNGEIFTKSDLESRQVSTLRQRNQQIDLKNANDQQLKKVLDEITPQILAESVDEMLLEQRGKELGYTMNDEQFKTIVENIRKENKLETDEQFQAALQTENLSMAQLRRSLERSMILQRVQQNEVMGKVGVTDEEAQAYYQSHLSQFTTAPAVMLREILVPVPMDAKGGVNAAEDEAARVKAEQLRARITAGENFDKVAADASESPSRANGGLIGPLNMNDLTADFRKMIEGMKSGDVTAVLRTQRGYQILKLESSTVTETLPFAEARQQISDRVFTDKRKEQMQKYLEKLRAQAIIEWKNQDLRKLYEAGLKQQAVARGSS